MANKRDTSAQRRARENRARRQALEARTKGAPPARPSRVAPSTAERLKRGAEDKAAGRVGASTASGSTDGAGKPRRERPPRPGDRPVDVDALEGRWFSKVMKVPGGLQILFAAVMAVVATALMSFTPVFVAEADADRPKPKATQTVFEAKSLPVALAMVGIPLLIAGVALAFALRPQRRRVWLVAAILLGALSMSQVPLYLIVAGFLAYGVFRSARVEGPNEPLLGSLLGRGRGATAEPTDADADAEASTEASDGGAAPDAGALDEGDPADGTPDDGVLDAPAPADGPARPSRRFPSR